MNIFQIPFKSKGFWHTIDHCQRYGSSNTPYRNSVQVLHLVTYLDVGNLCEKSIETALHEICVQVFLRFSIPASQANPYR